MKVTASWRKDLNCFRYSIHDEEFIRIVGKRIRGNCPKTVRSKKAAIQIGEQRRAALIVQSQSIKPLPAIPTSLPDGRRKPLASDLFSLFVTQFYLPHLTTTKAATTVHSEGWRARQLVKYFGKYRLEEIDKLLCLAYQTERKQRVNRFGRHDSNVTINHLIEVLQFVLQLAVNWGVLPSNPAKGIKSLRQQHRDRVMTFEEETRLFTALSASVRRRWLRLAVTIALHAGLRKSEILRLEKRDLDFERGLILIRNGKTGNGTVPLNQAIIEAIQQTIELALYKDQDPVFGGVDCIKETFPAMCREAGITGLHFHDLRATFVTRILENGYDAFTAAAAARHSNIKTTAIYARTSSQHLRAAVESLSKFAPNLSRPCPGAPVGKVIKFRQAA